MAKNEGPRARLKQLAAAKGFKADIAAICVSLAAVMAATLFLEQGTPKMLLCLIGCISGMGGVNHLCKSIGLLHNPAARQLMDGGDNTGAE